MLLLCLCLMDHFKESREKTAWGGSIAGGLVFFCVPLSTMVMTRLKIRFSAILGILMCITSLVATSFTTNIIQLFFSYSILYGLGMSLVFTSCIFASTKYFDKRQAIAIGIVTGGTNIGVLSLGPIVQLLIDLYGFRTMYRIMAGSFVLPLLAVCSFDPNVEDPVDKEKQFRENEDPVDEEREHRGNEDQPGDHEWNWSMVLEIFKRPMYVVALIVFTLQAMTAFISFVHLVNYCREVGISVQKASNLFIAIGVSSMIAGIIAGRVMDYKRVNPFHVNQAGALSMGIATTLLQLSSNYIFFIFFSIFLGFGTGVFSTTIVVLLLRTVEPRLRIYSFPIGQMISAIGNFTGPPLIGFIADTVGSYKPAFYTAGAILLLSFFLPFLQYYFKPWRTLEMEEQPTQIETNESPDHRDILDDRQTVDEEERVAGLEMKDKGYTQDGTNIPSNVNLAVEEDCVTIHENISATSE
ncbi:monocarboxylate transporter 12-like [Actinia tenebrosa]|uniref:Monocarboxylate transporter 12-like n=1 Tax=Actinia tenebrosa TaxID=6105 RepID=A0A6P8HFU5_ACTTE|nr:monocarboxylate transporter 12-like [Actinia tenebrosa]